MAITKSNLSAVVHIIIIVSVTQAIYPAMRILVSSCAILKQVVQDGAPYSRTGVISVGAILHIITTIGAAILDR